MAVIVATSDSLRWKRWTDASLPELRACGARVFVVPWGHRYDLLRAEAEAAGASVVDGRPLTTVQAKRNEAFVRCQAEAYDLVAFVDDDVYLGKGWGDAMALAIEQNPQTSAFGTRIWCERPLGSGTTKRVQSVGHTFSEGRAADLAVVGRSFSSNFIGPCGGACVVRRGALEELKALGEIWDPAFGRFSMCHDFGMRLRLLGHCVSYVAGANAIHTGFPSQPVPHGAVAETLRDFLVSNVLLFEKFLGGQDRERAVETLRRSYEPFFGRRTMWHPFQAIDKRAILQLFDEAVETAASRGSQVRQVWHNAFGDVARELFHIV